MAYEYATSVDVTFEGKAWAAFEELIAESNRELTRAVLGSPRTSVEMLARAIFRTDPEVMAHVDHVGDWTAPGQRHCSLRTSDDPRYERALQIAWDRDERGWRTRAVERAEVMADWLDGGTP